MSKRQSTTFNDEKEAWISDSVSRHLKALISKEKPILPLKYKSLDVLLRDATVGDLLDIKKAIDAELATRTRIITLVLKRPGYNWKKEDIIVNELKYIAYSDYIKMNYPNYGENWVSYALWLTEHRAPDQESQKALAKELIPDLYWFLYDISTRQELEDFQRNILTYDVVGNYSYDSPENPYLIKALERLQKKHIKPQSLLLYYLEVPFGYKYKIKNDEVYGQYPVIKKR